MAATDLYTTCREYLDACSDALALSPGGPIGHSYVSPGLPAYDCCPQLTVHAGGPQLADTASVSPPLQPGHRIVETGLVNLVTMTATVIRCVDVISEQGVLPTAASLEATAAETLGDVWTIWNHLVTEKRAGNLWAPNTRELFLDPAVSVITSGGCAGWQIQVRVALGGYRTAV